LCVLCWQISDYYEIYYVAVLLKWKDTVVPVLKREKFSNRKILSNQITTLDPETLRLFEEIEKARNKQTKFEKLALDIIIQEDKTRKHY
jgi:hypothetical protein